MGFKTGLKAGFPRFCLHKLVGNARDIPTQTAPAERMFLYSIAAGVVKTERFLEIGSYLGGSSTVLAEALRRKARNGGQLFCIDTWENHAMSDGQRATWTDFQRNIAPWKQYITPIRGKSDTVAVPYDGEFDLVFIDADHTYEGCLADVNRFSGRVREGGQLVMHDHAYYSGVSRVVGELLKSGTWYVARSVDNIISLTRDSNWTNRNVAKSFE